MGKPKSKYKTRVILQDPTKLKHAEKMREHRLTWSDEQKEKNRELSKLRMQRYRMRKKIELELSKNKTPVITRQDVLKEEKRKQKQREYRAKYRAALTSQKKRRIREKDARRKRCKRALQKAEKEKSSTKKACNADHKVTSTYKSKEAFRKAVYRAKKKLPKSPGKYAKVLAQLVTKVTPKRKSALSEHGIVTPTSRKNLDNMFKVIKEADSNLKSQKSNRRNRKLFVSQLAKQIKKKYGLQAILCRSTGINKKYFSNACQLTPKKRKDSVSTETVKSVQEFFLRENISIFIPNKKCTKGLERKRVMSCSLYHAWQEWKKHGENPGRPRLSFSKFCELRPKNILTQKHNKLYQCLCEYCENVTLKINSLNKISQSETHKIKNKFDAINATLCTKEVNEEFHNKKCLYRECTKCGVSKLEAVLTKNVALMEAALWQKWSLVRKINPKTSNNIKKIQQIELRGTGKDLIDELTGEVSFLSKHLFESQWQIKQFSGLVKDVPANTVVLTIDFAENFSCFAQNEVQAAHWSKDSVTIHPAIANYKCPIDGHIIEEAIDIVSDDLLHDSHAVYRFLQFIFKHLQDERHLNIKHVYILSDGCAAQYKSRIPFLDTSFSLEEFGFIIERHYYGSRHGKNRCDGEGGVLKAFATRAVKNGKEIINDAKGFFNVCKENLEKLSDINDSSGCNHKKRKLIFVAKDDIDHHRLNRDCQTVKGTQKVHAVLGVRTGVIKTRNLSCFCQACRCQDYVDCLNGRYVDPWKVEQLKIKVNTIKADVDVSRDAVDVLDLHTEPVGLPASLHPSSSLAYDSTDEWELQAPLTPLADEKLLNSVRTILVGLMYSQMIGLLQFLTGNGIQDKWRKSTVKARKAHWPQSVLWSLKAQNISHGRFTLIVRQSLSTQYYARFRHRHFLFPRSCSNCQRKI